MTDLQHVNVKLFAKEGSTVDWPELIPVFHRWIQSASLPEMLVDVADYAHVPAGPGIMLIGHEAFYSVDNRENRLGFLYNRRTTLDGTPEERLRQAYDAAVRGARMLASEPALTKSISFDERSCEVTVNDRALAPNTPETFEALRPVISDVFGSLWGEGVELVWNSDPRGLFRVGVTPAE